MRKLLIILSLSIFTTCLVYCETISVNEKSNEVQKNQNFESNQNSIKTKRYAGLRYLPPAYSGLNYIRHTPYSSFPGRFRPAYTLAPGNAVVHSYNANFPRILYPRPILRPALPAPPPIVPSIPVYTHRYPVFVQKPFVVPKPIAVPNFVSTISSPHVHTAHPVPFPLQGDVGVLPTSSIIPPNGWKPLYSSIPSVASPPPVSAVPFFPSHSHLNLAPSTHPQRPSNYYLPLPVHDVSTHAHSTHDGLSHENGIHSFYM